MAIWVKFVDPNWYDFVSTRPALDEINLWTAPGRGGLDGAETGDLVLFRVRGRRGVAGYGTFFHAAIYWADDAWDIFAERNGALTREAFVDQIKAQRTGKGLKLYAVACHDIVQPTWFDRLRARLPEEALQRLGSGPVEEESPDACCGFWSSPNPRPTMRLCRRGLSSRDPGGHDQSGRANQGSV